MLVFRHPNQQDSIAVYDADREIANLYYLRNGSPTWEPILQAIRNAQQKVQAAA